MLLFSCVLWCLVNLSFVLAQAEEETTTTSTTADPCPYIPPPYKTNIELGSSYAKIEWNLTVATCPSLAALKTNCSSDFNNVSNTVDITSETTAVVTNLTNLRYSTNYTCYAVVTTEDGSRSSTVTSFPFKTTSLEPLRLHVDAQDTWFGLTWDAPDVSTNLTYEIILTDAHSAHFVPESCRLNISLKTLGNTTDLTFNYTKAHPDYNYSIVVNAYEKEDMSRENAVSKGNITFKTLESVPGQPRNLQVDNPQLNENLTKFSVNVSWQIPCEPNGRISGYTIKIWGNYTETEESDYRDVSVNSVDGQENFTYLIDDLWASTAYVVSVFASNGEKEGMDSERINFTTLDSYPGPPNVTYTTVGPTSFNLSWTQPEGKFGNITMYEVLIESIEPFYDFNPHDCNTSYTKSTNITDGRMFFYYDGAKPFYDHHVLVSAYTSAGKGQNGSLSVLTKPGVPDAPAHLEVKLDQKSTCTISWELPCLVNGQISHFSLNIAGIYTEDSSLVNSNSSEIPYESGIFNYSETVNSLLESYHYNISVYVVLIGGTPGKMDSRNVTTEPGIPGLPTELDVTPTILTETFELTWGPPEKKNGKIWEYQILIVPVQPLYSVENCSILNPTNTVTTEKNEIQIRLASNFLYYYEYHVKIRARTKKGYGEYLLINTTSIPGTPQVPTINDRLIDVALSEDYQATATIKFEPSCFLNGPLENYTLDYSATNNPFEDQLHNRTAINEAPFEFVVELQPELRYYYRIITYNSFVNSTSGEMFFDSPAGVPKLNDSVFNSIPIDTKDTKVGITLRKSDFSDPNGKIRYIALILTDKNVTGKEFERYNETWPAASNPDAGIYYQLTEDEWQPFKDTEETTFTIGSGPDNCSETTTYCNKPLQRNKEYYLIVRSFTNNFYRNSPTIKFKTSNTRQLIIIFGILFGLLILAGMGFVYFMWKRKSIRLPRLPYIKYANKELVGASSTAIPVKKFIQYCRSLGNNDKLKEEYQLLHEKSKEIATTHTSNFAHLTENRRKNRYINILPFDETRVTLNIDEDDDLGSDYINASYIKGYTGQVEYIATQGPLEPTCRDFWKMILQENVSIIVMVSQFVEQDKEKCYRYFPRNREIMIVDDIEVKCCTELHFGIYCIRMLQVAKENLQTNIIHMQFLDWPDFGVPNGTEHMLQFCYQLRNRIKLEGGCTVVHCSAGVGRTGTLIATDILLQMANAERNIDVFNTVLKLRKQRQNMVQTEKQYIYIYSLIKDHLDRPPTPDSIENTGPIYENMSVLQKKGETEDEDTNNQSGRQQESSF